jgi:DNA/RNA endonuclease G (NUC1)
VLLNSRRNREQAAMASDRTERAKQFLEQIMAQEESLEALHDDPHRLESVAERSTAQPEEIDAAKNAVEKIQMGHDLSPDEQFALEAIIIPDKRPAIDVVDGDYHVAHPLWTHFESDAGIHQRLRQVIPSIGRVELPGHPTIPYAGTGFVVGDELLMTNRHVAEIFADGLGTRAITFKPGYSSGIDFKQERNRPAKLFLKAIEVVMIHPYWDMALLRVAGLSPAQAPLVLSLRNPEELVDHDIAVIGYPAFDVRNPADVQNKVFDGVYYVKRLQPGKLKPRERVDSFGNRVLAAAHDSSTLGGNSGSAVFDVATGQVIALHFGGSYLKSNFGVPTFELARDARVIATKVKFDTGAKAQPIEWEDSWRRTDMEFPSRTPASVPAPIAAVSASAPATQQALGGSQTATWTFPIEITVRVGGAATALAPGAPAAAAPGVVEVEKMVEPFHDDDYSTREGYDADFIGAPVPLPTVTDLGLVARMDDGEHSIPYHHFSLVMHKIRRLALFTASNVDASAKRKKPEARKKYTRKVLGGLGDHDMEKWFVDPRIPETQQLPDRFFTKDNAAFDKGHLVRREDVAWGESYEEVRFANGDTFHTTNCSPQVAGFNRPGSVDNWGDLEKVVYAQADTERLCVFAGPVLDDADRTFIGVDDAGRVSVKIPTRFWKVIVARTAGKLQAFGFLLEQDLADVPLEFVVDASWRQHMISIADLEHTLGLLRFPDAVRQADQAGTDFGEAVRLISGIDMIEVGGKFDFDKGKEKPATTSQGRRRK